MSGDYEDLLRRALHSAVDPIEPPDDGLERIRARLTTPDPVPVAWVVAAYADLAGRVRAGLQSALVWLQSVPQRMMPGPPAASGQPGPEHEGYGVAQPATPRRPWFGRARLAAVLAAVTLIMAMSVSVVTPFGQQMLAQAGALLGAISGTSPGTGAGGTGAGGTGAGGTGSGPAAGTGAAAAHGSQNPGPPAASCASSTPAVAVPAASSPSPAGSSPASPSPSPGSSSPSPTVSPSSTSPSPTVSPSPTSASPASPNPSPSSSSPSPASAGDAGAERAPADVTGSSSDACAGQRPSTPSPTPDPSPSSPPAATLGPSSPPASSPSPSPSPSSAEPASTAPASSSPDSSSPATDAQ